MKTMANLKTSIEEIASWCDELAEFNPPGLSEAATKERYDMLTEISGRLRKLPMPAKSD